MSVDLRAPHLVEIVIDFFFLFLKSWLIFLKSWLFQFWRLGSETTSFGLCQHLFYLINLSLPQALKPSLDFVAQIPVELNYALLGRLAYFLQRVYQSGSAKVETLVELLVRNVANFGQDSGQRLILAYYKFVLIHGFFGCRSCRLLPSN